MQEQPIGAITHYFSRISVAALKLTGELKVGDTINIKGHGTDITQPIDSIQIDGQNVEQAGAGQEVGIKVQGHVKEHDVVYKVTD